jgi:3-phenylpropionate/trans-cinnamate dioxygenase ferredoxin reductase component
MAQAGMVIVGAGQAGARAALTLRERGWTGPVTLIGEEAFLPYERPPLSKALVLADEEPAPKTIIDAARLGELDIAHLARRAQAIDREAAEVVCDDGQRVPYHRLLLALGARARRLELPGAEQAHYVRTFEDAVALRPQLQAGRRVAIIGGGYLGLELAASAAGRGCIVTVIELAPRLLSRDVPAAIADAVAARHLAAGVTFILESTVERIEKHPNGAVVALADREHIACDLVIASVGAVPDTALAGHSGLDLTNGIKADHFLRTNDPEIFAAGDCCSFPHPLYEGRRIRLEAWHNAEDQGVAAAENMLGSENVYSAVPKFWSDQYDLTLQIVGLPGAGHSALHRRVEDVGDLHFHLAADGRLVAASGIGPTGKIARDVRLAEMLIERRAYPDPAKLVSPEVRLKSLLAA